ncbi:methyltransferase family protein [Nonomuraea guangzhouensis]|uniref:Methyltransferase n=1 Tax=Nonomuraea guangzhouensis TaxID=1291555 RepID=A0ABW4FYB2_9ACTN|nr:methyltransferase [Nonomuraea guangzhouensis]
MQLGPESDTVAGPADAANLPPHRRLLLFFQGKRVSQMIYALTVLGVADHLARGPMTAAELAEAVGADAGALYRVLRCTASVGVFSQQPDGRFALTPMADALRTDSAVSQRDVVLFDGHEAMWRPLGEILHTLRTGEPAVTLALAGQQADDAPRRWHKARFDRVADEALVAGFDFARFRKITQIGGGSPLPGLAPGHVRAVSEVPEVPDGSEAYLLRHPVHEWDDDRVRETLGRIRQAVGGETRLLLCAFVLSGPNAWDTGKFADVDIMLTGGGRHRDLAEWRRLVGSAGFELVDPPRTGSWAVLECRLVY